MSPQQVLAVAVRLFAVWLFLYAAGNAANSFFIARSHGTEIPIQSFLVGLTLVVTVCAVLWAFPLFIARAILPKSTGQPEQSPTFQNWFSVGCSLIGVWILAKAISALAGYLLVDFLGYKLFPNSFQVNPDWPLYVTYNVFQFCFGIWLLFGAKGLKALLLRVRRDF